MPLQTFSGRNPSQNEFELRSFIALLRDRGVTRYLEIGARHEHHTYRQPVGADVAVGVGVTAGAFEPLR